MTLVPDDVCSFHGVEPHAPAPGEKVGLSPSARVGAPVHGVRIDPSEGNSGWFIWAGEMGDSDDFFDPVHVAHLASVCPLAIPFLSLPAGWRFLTDGEYCDVWFDPEGV